jgi:hypothetical protein
MPYWFFLVNELPSNVPPRLRDGGMQVRGDAQGGNVWKYPHILGILGKWGTGGRRIYNIKNIKYEILKIKIIMIKSNQKTIHPMQVHQ